jgi:hypothetical protein
MYFSRGFQYSLVRQSNRSVSRHRKAAVATWRYVHPLSLDIVLHVRRNSDSSEISWTQSAFLSAALYGPYTYPKFARDGVKLAPVASKGID